MRRIALRSVLIVLGIVILMLAGCAGALDDLDPPVPTISTTTTSPNSVPSTMTEQPTSTATTESQPASPSEPSNDCSGWNTEKDEGGSLGTDIEIYKVRQGLHDCYERLVFDLNGATKDVHYQVEYVDTVFTEAKGDPLPIPGSQAYLQVVIFAPAQGYDSSGHQPGKQLVAWGGYIIGPDKLCDDDRPVCGVRFGGTHEGQSTFAIGVSAELRFRAWSQVDGRNAVTKIVVDVAFGR